MRSFGSRPEVWQLGPRPHARAVPSWLCGRREAPWQRALRPPLCALCSVTGMGRLREARWYLWKRWEPISSDPSHPPRCLASGHLCEIHSPLLSFGCAVSNLGPLGALRCLWPFAQRCSRNLDQLSRPPPRLASSCSCLRTQRKSQVFRGTSLSSPGPLSAGLPKHPGHASNIAHNTGVEAVPL